MLMKSLEVVLDGGLVIAREGIDPALASDFQNEWIISLGNTSRLESITEAKRVENTPIALDGKDERGVFLPVSVGQATKRVLHELSITEGPQLMMNINWQPAKTAQDFHKDLKLENDLAIIVHGGDNGAFDYSPDAEDKTEAEENHTTIELNAGDIVFSSHPYMFHRGRNKGDEMRVTGVITTSPAPISQADYLASLGIHEYRPGLIKRTLGKLGITG